MIVEKKLHQEIRCQINQEVDRLALYIANIVIKKLGSAGIHNCGNFLTIQFPLKIQGGRRFDFSVEIDLREIRGVKMIPPGPATTAFDWERFLKPTRPKEKSFFKKLSDFWWGKW